MKELESFPGSADRPVRAVAFKPDGTLVASGSNDGTIRLLATSEDTPFDFEAARNRIKRCLTATQRSSYNLDPAQPGWCKKGDKYLGPNK